MFASLDPGAIGVTAPWEQVISWAAQYGFEGVSVPVDLVLEQGSRKIRSLLDSQGLKASVFGLPTDYRSDKAAFDRDVARLPEQAKAASEAGLSRCSTWVLPGRKELSDSEYFNLLQHRLGECARILSTYGIRLGLEFLGPKTLRRDLGLASDGISNAESMLELVSAISVPGTGLLLDAWHWHTSAGTPALFDILSQDLVVDVHVNDAPAGIPTDDLVDNKRCLPGETGVIDLTSFFDGLRRIGYDGPVTVEPFSAELNALPDEQAISRTSEALRKYL
jgi:sugar phosphate isomerase/epimerase